MPIKSYSTYSKRVPYRRKYHKRITKRNVGFIALKRANWLQRQMQHDDEIKFIPSTTTGVTISNAWQFVHLTPIAQGTDITNRVGYQVTCKYLSMRYTMTINSAASIPCVIRFVILAFDHDSAPVAADIFEQVNVLGQYQIGAPNPFKILYDKSVTLRPGGGNNHNEKLNLQLRDMKLFYSGSASSALGKRQLYIGFICDQAGNVPTFDSDIRVGFTDD